MRQPVYQVAKWQTTFETSDSRRYKTLTWVSVPTSFSSNGYTSMLDEFGDDSPAIYGAWIALVKLAADCPNRGTLCTSKGKGLTASRLSRLSGFPANIFERLMPWASSPEVGWLIELDRDGVNRLPTVCQPSDDGLAVDCQPSGNRAANELPNQTQRDQTKRVTPNPERASCDIEDKRVELRTLAKSLGIGNLNCIDRAIEAGTQASDIRCVLGDAKEREPQPDPGVIQGRILAIADNPGIVKAPWPADIEKVQSLRNADRNHERRKQTRRDQVCRTGETESSAAIASVLHAGQVELKAEQDRQTERLATMTTDQKRQLAKELLNSMMLKRFNQDPDSTIAQDALVEAMTSKAMNGRAYA